MCNLINIHPSIHPSIHTYIHTYIHTSRAPIPILENNRTCSSIKQQIVVRFRVSCITLEKAILYIRVTNVVKSSQVK